MIIATSSNIADEMSGGASIRAYEEECKKRAAESRDKILFRQPESSHLGDCPICLIPLSTCCCKIICDGCDYANKMREDENGLEQSIEGSREQ